MTAKTLDVLIFIPLIPVIPFWFLPWHRWLPEKIAGPYFLYCAFAIWYFKNAWWAVLIAGFFGTAFCTATILEFRKAKILKHAREERARMSKEARNWPVADGFLLHSEQRPGADGALQLTLRYMYKVHDEEFFGIEPFTFASQQDAERFEAECRQQKLKVYYRQQNPEVCVLDLAGYALIGKNLACICP